MNQSILHLHIHLIFYFVVFYKDTNLCMTTGWREDSLTVKKISRTFILDLRLPKYKIQFSYLQNKTCGNVVVFIVYICVEEYILQF